MAPLLLLAALSHLPPPKPVVCSTATDPHVLSLAEWRAASLTQAYRASAGDAVQAPRVAPTHAEMIATAYRASAYREHDLARMQDQVASRASDGDCDGACRVDLLAVLAVIYLREGEDLYRSEVAAAQADCARCLTTPDCPGIAPDHDESRMWLEKAANKAQSALELAPEGPRADLSTATLGRAQLYLGRPDEARQTLLRLVRRWPDSPALPEALLILGELHAGESEAREAIQLWTRASRLDGPDRLFALYRLAWSQAQSGEPAFAAETLTEAVRSLPRAELDAAARDRWEDEIDRALVWFYADASRSEAIVAALTGAGRTDDPLAARLRGRVLGPLARAGVEAAIVLEQERANPALAGQLRAALDRPQPAR